jgi:hypothetical protein
MGPDRLELRSAIELAMIGSEGARIAGLVDLAKHPACLLVVRAMRHRLYIRCGGTICACASCTVRCYRTIASLPVTRFETRHDLIAVKMFEYAAGITDCSGESWLRSY